MCELFHDLFQHLTAVFLMPQNLCQRNGVGGIAAEKSLVNVHTYANDGTINLFALQIILDKHSHSFLVIEVDIVGPFNLESLSIAVERVTDGQSGNF